jgi:hypothetical protein
VQSNGDLFFNCLIHLIMSFFPLITAYPLKLM